MSDTPTTPATPPTAKRLLADFPPVGYEQWRKLVEAELKGVAFEKKLVSRTYEGIDLQPIYTSGDIQGLSHVASFPGFAPFVRGGRASGYLKSGWEISQELNQPGASEFNHAARVNLDRGLNAINMVLDRATRNGIDPDWAAPGEVGAGGLSIATLGDLEKALEGIDLEKVSLFVRSGSSALPFAAMLIALARKRGKDPARLQGCIEMDPIGVLSHEGRLPQSLEGAYHEMATLTRWALLGAPNLQTICVHTRAWQESGGTAVQELAFALAASLEYFRALDRRRIGVDEAAPRFRWALTVGTQYFMEIAKLRAARLLWSQFIAAMGGAEASQRLTIHARTSLWNKSCLDPHVNILRASVEAFAGAVGGCDSMQVGPFDEVIRPPDDFSRRLARNTQLILQKECDLTHVIDPAGGAWFVEWLTAEIAKRAWALFQEVEKRGGLVKALREGFPQQEVARAAAEKIKNLALRRDSMVGVNQYANPAEAPAEAKGFDARAFHRHRVGHVTAHRTASDDLQNTAVMERLARIVDLQDADLFEACMKAVSAGATLGEITRAIRIHDGRDEPITPVCITRAAAGYERLRRAVALHSKPPKGRPRVFLANLGPLAQHKARADFSRGFFDTAGFEVVYPQGFETAEKAADAAFQSGADVVVICSTDETYPAIVPALVKRLRVKRPGVTVVLAGYPQDQVEEHRKSGIDEFIHLRANALETLENISKRIGVKFDANS